MLLLCALALVAAGADDPWTKVKELKSGSEMKIWKRGAAQPVDAVFDELTEEKLIAVIKNEQMAIPKTEIDRIDAREKTTGKSKPTVESKTERGVTQPERPAAPPRSMKESQAGAPTMSSSSTVTWGSGKPGFETVYRRTATATKQQD